LKPPRSIGWQREADMPDARASPLQPSETFTAIDTNAALSQSWRAGA
jgi:hypothetical protein